MHIHLSVTVFNFFVFILFFRDFNYPNLNIIGKRDKIYNIGPLFVNIPYIDDNNQIKYKPMTNLIESCPICPTCKTCPIINKRPYIIGLAICGALIFILLCVLIYTKSKS